MSCQAVSNPADLTPPHGDIPAFLVIHVFSLSKPWIMLELWDHVRSIISIPV